MFSPENNIELFYVFLVLPEINEIPYEQYREMRKKMLHMHCILTKLIFSTAKDIIGIATESGRKGEGSEDLVYLDARVWTSKDQENAERVKTALIRAKLFDPQHRVEKTDYEYPPLNQPLEMQYTTSIKGKHKNKPGVCGSGKKTKKCCGTIS